MRDPINAIDAPAPERTRTIALGAAEFAVGIDRIEPERPGGQVLPEDYWCDLVQINGTWMAADEALSTWLHDQLNSALAAQIRKEAQ